MAKQKAQNTEKENEMETETKIKTLDAEQIAEVAADLDESDSLALVPVLQNVPAEVAVRLVELITSMSSSKPGLEEMARDWAPPLVKVRQPVSTDAPKTLEMGGFYTDLGEVLSKPFKFVPLYMWPGHLKFSEGDVAPSCRSEDTVMGQYGVKCKDCEEEPWKGGVATDCNKFRFLYAVNPDTWQIYRLQFGKTSYKAGGKLEKWMRGTPKCPWTKIYNLTSKEVERKGGGVYYVFDVEMTPETVTDPWLIKTGYTLHEKISLMRRNVLAAVSQVQQMAGEKAVQLIEKSESDFVTPQAAAEPDFSENKTL
jgi:hypothetical protein